MTQRINEGQLDGCYQENQVPYANTRSSRESLEIRVESQKLYETVVDENSLVSNDPASTVSAEETIANTEESVKLVGKVEESKINLAITKPIICSLGLFLGTIGIVLIVAGCCIFLENQPFGKDEESLDLTEYEIHMTHEYLYEMSITIHDNYESYYDSFLPNNCKADEYEIDVQMSSNLFSGTDDKVEIRLYGQNREPAEWFELTKPFHDGFERLSMDYYCVNFGKQSQRIGLLEKIGIRKFGSDRF